MSKIKRYLEELEAEIEEVFNDVENERIINNLSY